MKKIRIEIPRKEYNVYLGNGIFPQIKKMLRQERIAGDILLVIDRNVTKYYSELISNSFASYSNRVKRISINSTEKNKSFETVQKIHTTLIKNNFGRDSLIVAIGGGIVGDIAGFAASTFMRGIKYVQVPTTLLASVDSSVGGKTGINFGNTKNIIGSFYQPEVVIIDTAFFNTLPDQERLCGLGEIIKYCFLIDQRFFKYVKKNVNAILNNEARIIIQVISESIKFKGSVVEADERESGIRKVLNLGHTFAHAFEIQQNHKIKHGQAVIVGITCAVNLSYELGFISDSDLKKSLDLLLLMSDRIRLKKVEIHQLFSAMLKDKKNRDNQIKFVLIKEIGSILTDVPAEKRVITRSISKTIQNFT